MALQPPPIRIPGTDLDFDPGRIGDDIDGETGPIYETTGVAEEFDPDLWKSQTLGDISFLKPFFEASKKGLELHKQNAAFIKEIYEINKALMFATIDPIFAAIDAILDEIIKILKDLRGLGFYMLPVHAGSVEPNVGRNPMTGSLFFGKDVYVPATRIPAIGVPGQAMSPKDYKPSRLVAAGPGDPRAMDPITGEMNYVEAPQMSEDPLLFQKEGDMTGVVDHAYIKMNKYTNLMSITPGGILQTIDKSFDDLGDVPKFFKQAIADGEIETGLSEYVPNVVLPKTVDELIDPSYYKSGRPIFADSAKVGGVIFIMGMPDFDRFQTVLGNFNKLIDIGGLGQLLKDIKKLWKPAAQTHRLLLSKVATIKVAKGASGSLDLTTSGISSVDAQGHVTDDTDFYVMEEEVSGIFKKQDPEKTNRIIKNNRHVYARVVKVVESVQWINEVMDMNAARSMDSVDVDMTESRIRQKHIGTKVNRNPLPYMNQTLEIEYIESGGEEFQAGDLVYEAVPGVGTDMKDAEGKELAADDQRTTEYHQVKEGKCTVGIVVDAYDDNALPEAPNWSGKSLEQLIPALGPLLNKCEAEVKGIKSAVASAKKTLDPIIAWLDGKMADVQAFAKDIENILDLFANGLPATGMYSLYLEPRAGGIAKFRERMMAAGGPRKPPEDLKFCAGVCFLGGGPDNAVLLRSIDILALLLGLRKQTASELASAATMKELATPVFDENKIYVPDDIVFYKGKNYKCIKTTEAGELPLIYLINAETGSSSDLVINSTYWVLDSDVGAADTEVDVGDSRTPDEIAKAKLAWLSAAKGRLQTILDYLDGSPPSGKNLRQQIMDVNLFGSIDPVTQKYVGEDENIYIELLDLRNVDLAELNLLVQRLKELIQTIEVYLIQANLAVESDADVPKGSLRSKGKTLMIIKGEFIDEVDDFAAGQRRVRENTTITVLHPLLDSSGSTRSVESLANTTVATLEEEFPVDLDEVLPYNVILSDAVDTTYKHKAENRANTTHYYHPGYRLREYKAKANTISIAIPNDQGVYEQLPSWEAGQAGPQGSSRTTAHYPEGTIIKINGTVPVSEGYVQGTEGEEIILTGLENIQGVADTWMALGVSEDDQITVDFGTDAGGALTKTVDSTVGEEYIKIDSAFLLGQSTSPEMFLYHDKWSFEISDLTKAEQAKQAKIQGSRNKFKTYLEEINTLADAVYDDLTTLEAETWPPAASEE